MFSMEQKEAFKKSKSGEFTSLPEGEYRAHLQKVQSRSLGEKQEKKLMMTYEVFYPQSFDGDMHTQFINLDDMRSYSYLKFVLNQFNIDPDSIDLDGVVSALDDCVGDEIHFELLQNGKYQNFKLQAVIKKQDEDVVPMPTDDDLPF